MVSKEKTLLESMIFCYQNDICSGMVDEPDYEEVKQLFEDMIIELTRLVLNFRYHDEDKTCPCSPEFNIKKLFKKNENVFRNGWYLYPMPWKTLESIVEEGE